ncbi:MAG: uroporphyrinogen decarboxylase family protein [Eubacteriales bacterium]|nr:uroporphyrinogen decarboxylase family protein [Eubacteriales bacterium]
MEYTGRFMQVAANRDYSKSWQKPGTFPWMLQQPKPPITGRPYSIKENYIRCVKGEKPFWMPAYMTETNTIWPDAMEEHPVPEENGYDWWGVDWIMEERVQGMITKPGTRTISDFANWKEELEWPDLSVVDFKTDGAKIQKALDPDRAHIYECVEGIFERLHEMIPFTESLLAFYEEPELLEEFFQKMADYKIESCKKIFENYGRVDGVLYHDDWGTQRAGFFSNDMFEEQIMPATKRFLSFLKDEGKFIELHSCGKNMQYVPFMIEMGIDMWTPQLPINNPDELYEKYGDQMTFAFFVNIPHDADEAECRKIARDFVDHFGAKGRCMPCFMTDFTKPEQGMAAHDELFNYSLEYYNKLYNR